MRAIHNGMASIQLIRIIQTLQSLLGHLITRIRDPPIRLLQDGRSQVLIAMPPVRRTRRRAARAQTGRGSTGYQILDHVQVGKRTHCANLVVLRDFSQTGQTVLAVDVHGARTANTLTARSTIRPIRSVLPSKHKSGVLLVLNLEQSIQDHGTTTILYN